MCMLRFFFMALNRSLFYGKLERVLRDDVRLFHSFLIQTSTCNRGGYVDITVIHLEFQIESFVGGYNVDVTVIFYFFKSKTVLGNGMCILLSVSIASNCSLC